LWKAGFEYLGNNHSEFNEKPFLINLLADIKNLIAWESSPIKKAPESELRRFRG
jgi:hypothetical protein